MDEFKNLEEILTAAKKIGEKLQVELDELQIEKTLLMEENLKLNNSIAALRTENERLRAVIENFGQNLQVLPNRLNLLIQEEFQNFFAESFAVSNEKAMVKTAGAAEVLNTEENLPANVEPKKKLMYADFYAEEAHFEED